MSLQDRIQEARQQRRREQTAQPEAAAAREAVELAEFEARFRKDFSQIVDELAELEFVRDAWRGPKATFTVAGAHDTWKVTQYYGADDTRWPVHCGIPGSIRCEGFTHWCTRETPVEDLIEALSRIY